MKILSYVDFINESTSNIEKAEMLLRDKELTLLMQKCEAGENVSIQIIRTEGATSYIGVALNDGEPVASVFHVSDPILAMVAIIIKNTKSDNIDTVKKEVKRQNQLLRYSVYPGKHTPTAKEVADRFNIRYGDFSNDNLPWMISTPINKRA